MDITINSQKQNIQKDALLHSTLEIEKKLTYRNMTKLHLSSNFWLFIYIVALSTTEVFSIDTKVTRPNVPTVNHKVTRLGGTTTKPSIVDTNHTKKSRSFPVSPSRSFANMHNNTVPLGTSKTPIRPASASKQRDPLTNTKTEATLYDSCVDVTFFLKTDSYASEISIQLSDYYTYETIWSGGAFFPNTFYQITSDCLDVYGCYEFAITDSYGDGLYCDTYDEGCFEILYDGISYGYGDTFGSYAVYHFGDGCYYY